jgi:hypothetical protein
MEEIRIKAGKSATKYNKAMILKIIFRVYSNHPGEETLFPGIVCK